MQSIDSLHRCDYARFLDPARTTVYGAEKYTGGQNGTQQQYPGLNGAPPLIIPSDRAVLHFHSDGSSTDWGYYAIVTGLDVEPESLAVPGASVALTLRDVDPDTLTAAYTAANRKPAERTDVPDSFSYKIRVKPVFTAASIASSPDISAEFEAYVAKHRLWTTALDRRLLSWIQDRTAKKPGLSQLSVQWADVLPSVAEEPASDAQPAVPAEDRGRVIEEAVVKFGFSVPTGTVGEDRLLGLKDRFNVLMDVNRCVLIQLHCQ